MARQHAVFQNRKSIVGAALVGLGLFVLFRDVAEAAVLIRFLRIIGDQADSLGLLAVASMAVQHLLQSYLFDHTEFLRILYQVLLSFLGLLLISAGTIFLPAVFAGREELKKRSGHVDFVASHSTHRWK
jgi:drug/metabolite transporter (DMT)-like permease